MCSILTVSSKNSIPDSITNNLDEALTVSRSRGPDAQGFTQPIPNVVLLSNRLSIVDTSEAGNMPISDSSGRYHIVFNGEIYNYSSLKKKVNNEYFKSNSDTEVLLHLLIKYGTDILPELDGMFAFYFIDIKTGNIIFARDRLGIKPLYYGYIDNCLIISSDIRTYLKFNNFNKAISYEAVTSFIKYRFIPAPLSIFKDVQKLKPGHYVKTTINNLTCKPIKYWEPTFLPLNDSYDEIKANLQELAHNSVSKSSIGDVPIGVLLSGGIDSSAVYQYAKQDGLNTTTFSCEYKVRNQEESYDSDGTSLIYKDQVESRFAEMMVRKHDDKLFKITIDLADIVEIFDSMIWDLGEPMASTDSIGHYLLAKNLPRNIKVLLTGTGADELLGGYTHLFLDGGKFIEGKVNAVDFLNKFSNPYAPTQDLTEIISSEYRKTEKINDNTKNLMDSFDIKRYPNEKINYHMFFELLFDLPGWELEQGDRLYMAYSKETRPAFLQNDFVDYCINIPSEYKFRNDSEKYIFKDALSSILPKEIVSRRKHPSLGTPQSVFSSNWFKERFEKAMKNKFGLLNTKIDEKLNIQLRNDYDLQYRLIVLDTWLNLIYS